MDWYGYSAWWLRSLGVFFFQAEDGIRDLVRSRGLGDVYKRQAETELRHELSRGLVDLLLFQALGQFVYNLPPWLNLSLIHI